MSNNYFEENNVQEMSDNFTFKKKPEYSQRVMGNTNLYREPKKRRKENEAEVIANYRASMNRGKRRYKQRKSKYDPEVWNSLPLHRPSKRMRNSKDEEFNSNNSDGDTRMTNMSNMKECTSEKMEQIEVANNVIPKQSDLSTVKLYAHLKCETKRKRNNRNRPNLKQDQEGKAESTGAHTNRDSPRENVSTDEYGNTLIVRKILRFLLEESDEKAKRNMILILSRDDNMKEICKKEIKKRFDFLKNLHDRIVSLIDKEQTNLRNLSTFLENEQTGSECLNRCEIVTDTGNWLGNESGADADNLCKPRNELLVTTVPITEKARFEDNHDVNETTSEVPTYTHDQNPEIKCKNRVEGIVNEKVYSDEISDEISDVISFSELPDGLLENVIITLPSELENSLVDIDFMNFDMSTDPSSSNLDNVLQSPELIKFKNDPKAFE